MPASTRRQLLALAVAGATGTGWLLTRNRTPPLPELTPRAQGGLVFLDGAARPSDALSVGLPTSERAPAAASVGDLWTALRDPATAPARLGTEGVPTVVAVFDYRCPFCRAHAPELWRRAEAGEIDVVWREWPILGPASVLAARAAMAAWLQDAYLPFHQALMQTGFVPNDGLVTETAHRLGLDVTAFDAARDSPLVASMLTHNDRVIRALGIPGVPIYVADRVVVAGGYDADQVLALSQRHAPRN